MSDHDVVMVRVAKPADAPELARLRWEFREEDQGRETREDFLHTCGEWIAGAIENGRWVIATAECSGSLVGCIYLQCVEKVPIPGESLRAWGYVTNSYVDSKWRRRGIGEEMLNILINASRERGLEFLIVWPSEEAVAFYQRAGFRDVSAVHLPPDDAPPLELLL